MYMKHYRLIRINALARDVEDTTGLSVKDFPMIERILNTYKRSGYVVQQMFPSAPVGTAVPGVLDTAGGFVFLMVRDSDRTLAPDMEGKDVLTPEDRKFLLETTRLPPHAKLAIANSLSKEDLEALCEELCPPSLH